LKKKKQKEKQKKIQKNINVGNNSPNNVMDLKRFKTQVYAPVE